ncbi:MAG: LysM peptidoglycan-binding domain-containing protein [Ignavibacteriales bacterium]
MNKIVPFKKNIIFKSNLSEITSISLEHTLHCEEEKIVGEFIISGEYKMVDTSVNTESFSFNLPFETTLDDYKLENAKIDIDDFYYEIINNNILRVNIDILVDQIEEIIHIVEEVEPEPEVIEETVGVERTDLIQENDIKTIFDSVEGGEVYATYKVCIVREEDTLESIIEKYNTNRDELELYNNLEDIKLGDKIIIPNAKD